MKRLDYQPEPVEKTIHVRGTKLELDGHQYSRYKELAGNALKDPAREGKGAWEYMDDVVSGKSRDSFQYQMRGKLPQLSPNDDSQRKFLQSTVESYREKARERLMFEDKKLQAQYDEANKNMPNKISARVLFGHAGTYKTSSDEKLSPD
jgi:hypothetical protein